MHARNSGPDWFVAFDAGTQLHDEYRAFAKKQGIAAAVVTAGIGMVRDPVLGYYDGEAYHQRAFRGSFELVSTQGNIALLDGEPFTHLHVTIAGRDHQAHAGHLFRGEVEVAHEGSVRVLEGVELTRAKDPATQLASLRW